MIRLLFEHLTGQPWTTARSASAEFGPPPGAVYREELAQFTDAQLYAHGPEILARLRGNAHAPASVS